MTEVELLKVQIRVGDVCSHYHMKRNVMLEEANVNANKAIESLCIEIDRLYNKLNEANQRIEKIMKV